MAQEYKATNQMGGIIVVATPPPSIVATSQERTAGRKKTTARMSDTPTTWRSNARRSDTATPNRTASAARHTRSSPKMKRLPATVALTWAKRTTGSHPNAGCVVDTTAKSSPDGTDT